MKNRWVTTTEYLGTYNKTGERYRVLHECFMDQGWNGVLCDAIYRMNLAVRQGVFLSDIKMHVEKKEFPETEEELDKLAREALQETARQVDDAVLEKVYKDAEEEQKGGPHADQ